MEKKNRPAGRYLFCILFLAAVFGAYLYRLYDWQILNGDAWLTTADNSTQTTVSMTAARGEILDVNGEPLAVNRTGYAIVLDWAYMRLDTMDETVKQENETIHQIITLLDEKGEEWTDVLPIVWQDGEYVFLPDMDKEIETLKGRDYADVNSYASAQLCMESLIEKYDVEGYTPEETRDIVSVRYNMTKNQFGLSNPYTMADDVSLEIVTILSENTQKLPGVSIQVTTTREYENTFLIPHIVGRMGKFSSMEDWENNYKDKGYAFDDSIGISGIESAFEDVLRGTDGEKVVEITSMGSVASETVTKAPVAGDTVYLTIDKRIQEVVNASLEENILGTRENGEYQNSINADGRSQNHGEDCYTGGAVVMDVKTGAILAASTYPTYDSVLAQEDASYYSSLANDTLGTPLVNKAFIGTFTPGSCFKPAVACAALEEGIITNSTVISCNHYYTRFTNGSTVGAPTCLGWHGAITLRSALADSCNIFFFETGYQLGITAMNLYCQRFGLGIKTGIEIGESAGVLAGPNSRDTWYQGETLNAAIGQSDNAFTPLQLCVYAATLANNGDRPRATLISKITDYTREEVKDEIELEIVENVGVSQENLDYVKEGMKAVITEGSAKSTLGNYPIEIAGKTGTAERSSGSDNVTFIGYAPADDPQIAFSVVLDHGASGRYCQNVVRDILDAYFYDAEVCEDGVIRTADERAEAAAETANASSEDGSASSAASGDSASSEA